MEKKDRFTWFLRLGLLVTIPSLLTLGLFQASAKRELQHSKSKMKLIRKASLPKSTLKERLAYLKPLVTPRLTETLSLIKKNKTHLTLIVYKKERTLELWFTGKTKKKIKTYKMTASSGKLGPKFKQGDLQIPEGVYRASHLNPNSKFYLSIGLNYPNSNDQKLAEVYKIKDPGGDIFIHGRNVTVGCVPIGDHYIEEVFYLVAQVGLINTKVIIAPSRLPLPNFEKLRVSEHELLVRNKYSRISAELAEYP